MIMLVVGKAVVMDRARLLGEPQKAAQSATSERLSKLKVI